jgi:hypothetical protein
MEAARMRKKNNKPIRRKIVLRLPDLAQLAATTSPKSTPLLRSNTTGSPVRASTAVIEHPAFQPVQIRQPGGDGSAPPGLGGPVQRSVHFERGRAHFTAHVGRIQGGGCNSARSLQMVGHRANGNASAIGFDGTAPWLGRGGKNGCKQFGRIRAGDLGRSRRFGRRPDDQISLGNIQSGIEKAGG